MIRSEVRGEVRRIASLRKAGSRKSSLSGSTIRGTRGFTNSPFLLDAAGGIPGAPDVECRGALYERFIIDELKPCIDRTFRTLPDRNNTGLMGSSLGGLITYHIGFRNPAVFSKLGIVSPHFVRLDLNTLEEFPFYRAYGFKELKVWIDIGEIESNLLTRHVRDAVDELTVGGFVPGYDLVYCEVPDAAHTEHDWAERLRTDSAARFLRSRIPGCA